MADHGGNQPLQVVVCRPMTMPRRLLPILATLTIFAGCAGSAAPSASPSRSPTGPPPASAVDLPTTDPGGGSSGSTGSGIVDPGLPTGGSDPDDPTGGGQAQLVRPRPGQKDPRPVAPTKLEASVDGRHLLVKVSWYGGVEPCNVLDSVKVERTGTDIAITPLEGTGDPGAMCIEIAVLKATIVDLGDLEPGTYRITAPTGDAPALAVTIS
ncbi:MAG TPA: hypothetical protein VFJ71_01855 [Candidatus Limnocylindrales bacterium]|nr:hypothetical protein [Candidatus Limnocylindrales bacterium]